MDPSVLAHAREEHCGRKEVDLDPAYEEAYCVKTEEDVVPEAAAYSGEIVQDRGAAWAFVRDSEVRNAAGVRHEEAVA